MERIFCAYRRMILRGALVALLLFPLSSFASAFQKGVSKSQLYKLDPQAEATSVLIETVKELMKNVQLAEAIPFQEEILVRLEGDEDDKARAMRSSTLFDLANSRMRLGEYEKAATDFARFSVEYPDDAQMAEARLLSAQCFTMMGNWAEAEVQAAEAMKVERLSAELKVLATKLVGESRYQQEKWADAVKPLVFVFQNAQQDQVRAGAAVMLVTSYVMLNDFDKLFRFLPFVDEGARHDVLLNVALLESGDSHYKQGDFEKALLLYRLVILKQDLEHYYANLLAEIRSTINPYVADGKISMADHEALMRERQLLFKRKARHYQKIKEFKDYDLDVALRIAQSYGDLDRNWPAYAIYQNIYTDFPTNKLAEQSRFLAFGSMLREGEWETALQEGYAYVDLLPEGEYIDDVTLNLLQLHMQQAQMDQAFSMGVKALALSPKHKYEDQIKYLLGYIKFLKLDYEESLAFFDEVLERWPDSMYYESAEYWRSMTMLFLGRFGDAVVSFKAYLSNPKYEKRQYEEDASYRLGIAQYGAEQFFDAEATFRKFVDVYSNSKLLSEAYSMLGDIRGAEGDLVVAVDFYGLAIKSAVNMSQRNYATFQMAKVYELNDRYADIIELMSNYLKEWGDEADFANACNWLAKSHKAMNRYDLALDAYFRTLDQYGNEADLEDADLILNELIKDYNGADYVAYREAIRGMLTSALEAARSANRRTLELRYETVFVKISAGDEREKYVDSILQSKNIPAAAPLTLVVMQQEGLKRGQLALVHQAYDRFMSTYKISNNMLYVMLANLEALSIEGEYEDAIALSEEILMKFGHSQSVARAWMVRGDVFRTQGKYDEAIETYNYLLGIREWRGALTPEAHYWLGICKQTQGHIREAYAHFQRVYVLYGEYTEWVARAYARSIECLKELGETEYIINTYKEMLLNEKIAETPEGKEARASLEKLQPAGGVQ